MKPEVKSRTNEHIIELICRRAGSAPNFSLLLGAGASKSSGVKTGAEMISDWRMQLFKRARTEKAIEIWLEEQEWYQDEDEYSLLFEEICDSPSQRRTLIESYIKDASPTWGYVYLSNLLAHNYFNVVFTPNFDDLVNEACFSYANLKPIVCAHDSAVADIRVTSSRPKILKLHGDFLYDNIKNTVRETESLEQNMRDKLRQFCREYGLVVVGYSGSDKSIMDTLEATLSLPNYLPNGVYWCTRRGHKLCKRLSRFLGREGVYHVEIDGFDQFMADIHSCAKLKLPLSLTDPYRATTDRLSQFLRVTNKPLEERAERQHSVIKADAEQLEIQIKRYQDVLCEGTKNADIKRSIVPYEVLGHLSFLNRKSYDAAVNYEKAIETGTTDQSIYWNLAISYDQLKENTKALIVLDRWIERFGPSWRAQFLKAFHLLRLKQPKDALKAVQEALSFPELEVRQTSLILSLGAEAYNQQGMWKEGGEWAKRAIEQDSSLTAAHTVYGVAMTNLGNDSEASVAANKLIEMQRGPYYDAIAYAILRDKRSLLESIRKATTVEVDINWEITHEMAFAAYRDDPEFIDAISSVAHNSEK